MHSELDTILYLIKYMKTNKITRIAGNTFSQYNDESYDYGYDIRAITFQDGTAVISTYLRDTDEYDNKCNELLYDLRTDGLTWDMYDLEELKAKAIDLSIKIAQDVLNLVKDKTDE